MLVFHRRVAGLMFAVAFGASALGTAPVQAAAAAAKKQKQSYIFDEDNNELSSSALMKLLNDKLDGVYQDLELVITSCGGGEFATRGAKLKGSWSVSTATDTSRCNTTSVGNTVDPKIGGKDGLKVGKYYFDGWNPQYIKKLLSDGNTATNKALFDYATANKGYTGSVPAYNSSGAAADNMTVHGGTSSNHAILLNSAIDSDVFGAWVDALKKAGYDTSGTVTELKSGAPKDADKATFANLTTALDTLRTQLNAHPNEEKAYININTHGSYGEKTVAYQNNHFNEAGGGATVTSTSGPLPIFADDPTVVAYLQEELPKFGGGYWANDPTMHRAGPAVFSFSTLAENFVTPGDVLVSLDGANIGAVGMGNSGGADYQLAISDAILSSIMSQITATGFIDVDFTLPNISDSFQLAVSEDYDGLNYPHLDYGLAVAANIAAASVPEPASLMVFGVGLAGLAALRRRRSAESLLTRRNNI